MDISSDKQAKYYTRRLEDLLRKGNRKREPGSLLIAVQNFAIYVKTKINKMQQNSKCWLSNDQSCEWSKLTHEEYKTWH